MGCCILHGCCISQGCVTSQGWRHKVPRHDTHSGEGVTTPRLDSCCVVLCVLVSCPTHCHSALDACLGAGVQFPRGLHRLYGGHHARILPRAPRRQLSWWRLPRSTTCFTPQPTATPSHSQPQLNCCTPLQPLPRLFSPSWASSLASLACRSTSQSCMRAATCQLLRPPQGVVQVEGRVHCQVGDVALVVRAVCPPHPCPCHPAETSATAAPALGETVLQLCTALRPEAVALVDALAPSDHALHAPIGRSDGQVYQVAAAPPPAPNPLHSPGPPLAPFATTLSQHLYAATLSAPGALARPAWWRQVVASNAPQRGSLSDKKAPEV